VQRALVCMLERQHGGGRSGGNDRVVACILQRRRAHAQVVLECSAAAAEAEAEAEVRDVGRAAAAIFTREIDFRSEGIGDRSALSFSFGCCPPGCVLALIPDNFVTANC
jgi:hypothetical protein